MGIPPHRAIKPTGEPPGKIRYLYMITDTIPMYQLVSLLREGQARLDGAVSAATGHYTQGADPLLTVLWTEDPADPLFAGLTPAQRGVLRGYALDQRELEQMYRDQQDRQADR